MTEREIILGQKEFGKSSVRDTTDMMKVKAAVAIAAAAILIGVAFLAVAIWIGDSELRTWATGLISLVVGTAIGFIFGGTNSSPSAN